MHRREYILSSVGIVGATTVGSIAYTTAEVERTVTSNIAADSAGIIGLTAGTVSAVTENGDGQLVIDTAVGDATGLNGDATFTYGDSTDLANQNAFSITNNDGASHDLTVSLNSMTLPTGSSFKIELFDANTNSLGVVEPGNDVTYNGWASGETIFAIITIDTTDATKGDDFSGNVKFSA